MEKIDSFKRTKTRDMILLAYKRGYRVTDDGKLISPFNREIRIKKRGKQRYPTFSINGVKEYTPSGVYGIPCHLFAAYCFYRDMSFEPNKVVRHLNSNTEDISRNNIRLGTHSENNLDKPIEVRIAAAKRARKSQGYRANNAKFTDEQVREIRQRVANGESPKHINKDYGVSDVTIYDMVKRRKYADVE